MWFLVGQERHSGLRIWLKPDTTLTIGRQIADDILPLGNDDISVGRRHIAITVSKPTMHSVRVRGEHTKLTIRDLSSKHGVYVNNERIEPAVDVEITINENCLWTNEDKRHVAGRGYGGFAEMAIGDKTAFRLERVDWSLCSQGLTAQAKVGIIGTAAEIDCNVEETWVPGTSTHLVIGKANRSEKLFLALAEGGHLVDVAWLKAVEASFKGSWGSKGQKDAQSLEVDHPAPVPAAYEDSNILWTPNFQRRKLFKDYRFISITPPKYQNLGQVIRCAGGEWTTTDATAAPKLINECLMATVIPVFLHPHKEENIGKNYPQLYTILTRMGYRWVQEDEIGMAIMYASTDMYCSPKYLEPLPTIEVMATLQSSQFASFPHSATLAATSSMIAPSTLSRSGSSTGDTRDTPQIIDDDEESAMASLSLSQLIPPFRKSARGVSSATVSPRDTPSGTGQLQKSTNVDKPAKKKTKTDRMAVFFDGLDDEDEVVDLDAVESKGSAGTSLEAVPCTPLLEVAPVARVDSNETAAGSQDQSGKICQGAVVIEDECEPELIVSQAMEVEAVEAVNRIRSTKAAYANKDKNPENTELNPLSQPSLSSAALGSRKKPSAFDGVREDMLALNLVVKVERQKESQDEQVRLRQLEAQRAQENSKGDISKLMQSEWSESLLVKGKRQKLEGKPGLGPEDDSQASLQMDRRERSASVQLLTEADKKDWPERWKNVPNFKNMGMVDAIMKEKWKAVPNFKAFRKSAVAGIHVESRKPASLTMDGEVAKKHEEAFHKIGRYIKREPQEPSAPFPTPRRKKSEKQMVKDDLKLLLGDD